MSWALRLAWPQGAAMGREDVSRWEKHKAERLAQKPSPWMCRSGARKPPHSSEVMAGLKHPFPPGVAMLPVASTAI